jgi:hypothetical protein
VTQFLAKISALQETFLAFLGREKGLFLGGGQKSPASESDDRRRKNISSVRCPASIRRPLPDSLATFLGSTPKKSLRPPSRTQKSSHASPATAEPKLFSQIHLGASAHFMYDVVRGWHWHFYKRALTNAVRNLFVRRLTVRGLLAGAVRSSPPRRESSSNGLPLHP